MKDSPANLSEIHGFHAISEKLGTAGQPTQSQFPMIRESGFKVNLFTYNNNCAGFYFMVYYFLYIKHFQEQNS